MARAPSTPPAAPSLSAIAPAGARLMFVVQETGGVGKSTVARALAEAVEDAPVYEIESSTRLLELGERVRHFPIRVDSAELMKTGGEAAMVEFNPVINALVRETRPPSSISAPMGCPIPCRRRASRRSVRPTQPRARCALRSCRP